MTASSIRKTTLVTIIVAGLLGAAAGLSANILFAPHPESVAPQTRDFYLFTSIIPFNETTVGVPHDIFTPDRITVNQGDTVVIHYYNLEDQPEDHTFTLQAPFWTQSGVTFQGAPWNSGNIIVHQNQRVNITFTASQGGVFRYWCTYHQPTMTGYLVVLSE